MAVEIACLSLPLRPVADALRALGDSSLPDTALSGGIRKIRVHAETSDAVLTYAASLSQIEDG